jgi:hypothetical protein
LKKVAVLCYGTLRENHKLTLPLFVEKQCAKDGIRAIIIYPDKKNKPILSV